MSDHDLIIRSGLVVDGDGGEPFAGDVAVDGGVITAVGAVPGRGRQELDAGGAVIAPGFVDVHTHYDGQATWDSRLQPSSWHGVTTAVMGNCGVGFAPVQTGNRDRLVEPHGRCRGHSRLGPPGRADLGLAVVRRLSRCTGQAAV